MAQGKFTATDKFALLSVSNKEKIPEFAKVLEKLNYKIISTGGTYKVLGKAGINVIPIEDITGNPRDSFDGRMKSISFAIEGGILFDRNNPSHVNQAKTLGVPQIDIVVCNLYPFEEKPSIENIDVGGPTMIRSAAKNHTSCLVVVDPEDYELVAKALEEENITTQLRQELAAKAFYHLSFYDAQIGKFFSKEQFPKEITLPLRKRIDLRYGENPHQKAALYEIPKTNSPIAKLEYLWGRKLSETNIGDIYAGIETVRQFSQAAAVVVKHHTACGVGLGKDATEALDRAIEADPISAFGGVVVLNKPMDTEAAQVIGQFKGETKGNMDIIAVPEIDEKTLELLKAYRKSMGIYTFGELPRVRSEGFDVKWFEGGVVLQTFDDIDENSFKDWTVVTKVKPTKDQLTQMQFGWKVVKALRSNAVIVLDETIPMTRGIGTGQTSRVSATEIALKQADKFTKNGILVSDSFFPFDDCVKLAAKQGIATIVQQGGSIHDQDSIDAADDVNIAMVFTNRRAFRH